MLYENRQHFPPDSTLKQGFMTPIVLKNHTKEKKREKKRAEEKNDWQYP